MKYRHLFLFCLLILACRKVTAPIQDISAPSPMRCAPQLSDADWYTQNIPAPLFEGMDKLNYPITTSSPEAQRYFNQGLLLAYAFNHAEAARSFYHAMRIDSACAMCHWGYAFVLGPNYNAGMEADHYNRAYNAIQKALAISVGCTPKEKDLIQAMSTRYTKEPPESRHHLDSAFNAAMKTVHMKYPDDVDIAAIYAESLMDMHPWDLWERDGTPKPWTPEIIKAIDVCIRINPNHPGGHHFNIHAWEASNTPEKAMVSSKRFDDGLVAHAGHLVHMPSHIYINTGDYHLGSLANIQALKQDSQYVTQCHAQGAYPLAYYPHNYHFLAATATLEGKREWAVDAANRMSRHVNHTGMLVPELATLQHYYAIPYFVHVKFGLWDAILKMPPVDTSLLYPAGIRHYARGMAYLGKGDVPKAFDELEALSKIADQDTLKVLTIWEINSLFNVIDVAQKVLEGEILAAQGKYEQSIRALEDAVATEIGLNYNEPPDWFFSVRHHLGDVLIKAGKPQEAIAVYEADLLVFPKNGWALSGLKKAYEASGMIEKGTQIEVKLKEAWAFADVRLDGSKVIQ